MMVLGVSGPLRLGRSRLIRRIAQQIAHEPLRCGQVIVKFPTGIGLYEVQQCTSRTCDSAGTSALN